MRIAHALQSLMSCILPTMHYWSEHCWSCCIRLHITATTNVTTRNIVGPTMMGVIPSVCTSARAFFRFLREGVGWGLQRLPAKSLPGLNRVNLHPQLTTRTSYIQLEKFGEHLRS